MSESSLQQIIRMYRETKSPYWKKVYEALLTGEISALAPAPKPEKPKGGFEFL